MLDSTLQLQHLATLFLVLALVHTFLIPVFSKAIKLNAKPSFRDHILHGLCEVELVFAVWAILFLFIGYVFQSRALVLSFISEINISEPFFIFCVVVMGSAKPILRFSQAIIFKLSEKISKVLSLASIQCQVFILLVLGPLLGSIVTEPAAMTIISLLLLRMLSGAEHSSRFLYSLLAVVFVNISVGGALTHFAAPPILMVARLWQWDFFSVFRNLGLAALFTVVANAVFFSVYFKKTILLLRPLELETESCPPWIIACHIFFVGLAVGYLHYPLVIMVLVLLYFIFYKLTRKFQGKLRWKEAALVALFLLGLIVLGSFQRWWVEPLIVGLNQFTLFFGAVALTAVTDNAALTFLGSQVPDLSKAAQWALVSGALAGGGLTILANAPNPIGFTLLSSKFPGQALNSGKLFLAALLPTTVAVLCFLLFGAF